MKDQGTYFKELKKESIYLLRCPPRALGWSISTKWMVEVNVGRRDIYIAIGMAKMYFCLLIAHYNCLTLALPFA